MKKYIKIIRWIARILGSLLAGFYAFMLIMEVAFPHGSETNDAQAQGIILGCLAIILVIGVIIAWFKEKIGSYILIPAAIALSIFGFVTAGRYEILVALLSGGPYLLVGILFLISSKKYENTKH